MRFYLNMVVHSVQVLCGHSVTIYHVYLKKKKNATTATVLNNKIIHLQGILALSSVFAPQ